MMYRTMVAVRKAEPHATANMAISIVSNQSGTLLPFMCSTEATLTLAKYRMLLSNVHELNVTNFWNPVGCNMVIDSCS